MKFAKDNLAWQKWQKQNQDMPNEINLEDIPGDVELN